MAQIAAMLGQDEDAARYRQLFAEVKAAFASATWPGARSAWNPTQVATIETPADGTWRIDLAGQLKAVDYGPVESEVFNTDLFTPNQTAYILALHFDLLPEELRPRAIAELVADIERREMHLSTGFVGSPYLPHVLSSNGRLDVAYALLNQKTWPSWLYAVTQGATTIWERWDGWTEDNGFQDPQMNSFNHYAYGAIGAWLYNTVAGIEIDPAQPGYKHIVLRPQPGGSLTRASGRLKSMYGDICSEWSLDNGRFEWSIQIPPNASATVHVPAKAGQSVIMNGSPVQEMVQDLAAGDYRFVVED